MQTAPNWATTTRSVATWVAMPAGVTVWNEKTKTAAAPAGGVQVGAAQDLVLRKVANFLSNWFIHATKHAQNANGIPLGIKARVL